MMSMVFLVFMTHGHLQFMIPMPDARTCMQGNLSVAEEMLSKDPAVKAEVGCFDMARQAFWQLRGQGQPTPDSERLD